MEITASMVKELREISGAGMMDCKKALAATNGNMDEAVDFLRKSGVMKAEKKASRIAAEGICKVLVEGNTAVAVEVNSETDFVAKNEKFLDFVNEVANQALKTNATDMDAFLAENWIADSTKTVQEALVEKIAVIGEKLSIRRFEKVVAENGCVVSYTHAGGRIGVIIEAETDVVNDAIKEALTNLAMQVAALSPKFISSTDVDQDYIAHEKEIILEQIKNDPKEASKPEKVIEGMINGRINKELKDVCLLEQVYVKAEDGKQQVKAYLDQVAKANNAKLSIKKMVRFETGEGIEKKQENFAEEVAAQMK